MQIDMHYYGTYAIARAAGLALDVARVIATSAQFVDDNAQKTDLKFKDGSSCSVEATAHHTTSVTNLFPDDQRKVWVPFHFLPGNKGESFTEQLICRKNSLIAQQMRDNHITQSGKSYYLELVGVMAHVYADTFAHYGFSGVSSRKNKVINDSFKFKNLNTEVEKYITDRKDSFITKFGSSLIQNIKSNLAEECSGALGHAGVVTFPDRPYLKWNFDYQDGTKSGLRDNTETFLEFSKAIHAIFSVIAENNPEYQDKSQFREWEQLKPEVLEILKVQGKKDERIKAWQHAAESGALFNFQEKIPVYQDWNSVFENLDDSKAELTFKEPVYRFYQAASYHRWYVLRELLPSHGIMVI